jgi:hypothetical protein
VEILATVPGQVRSSSVRDRAGEIAPPVIDNRFRRRMAHLTRLSQFSTTPTPADLLNVLEEKNSAPVFS